MRTALNKNFKVWIKIMNLSDHLPLKLLNTELQLILSGGHENQSASLDP
jgi:hypothetical protein